MDFPTTRRLKFVLALVTILFVASLIATVTYQFVNRPEPFEPIDPRVAPVRPQASGVVLRLELGEQMRGVVRVERLDRQQRKLGPLTINPTSRYVMSGVHIELKLAGPTETPLPRTPPPTEFIGQLLQREELNPLSRVDIERFEYVLSRSDETVFEIRAGRVTVDPRQDGIQLSDGFFVATVNGQRLVASRGSLNLKNDTLTVDSAYLLTNGDGSGESGRDGVFLLDTSSLEIRSAPPSPAGGS